MHELLGVWTSTTATCPVRYRASRIIARSSVPVRTRNLVLSTSSGFCRVPGMSGRSYDRPAPGGPRRQSPPGSGERGVQVHRPFRARARQRTGRPRRRRRLAPVARSGRPHRARRRPHRPGGVEAVVIGTRPEAAEATMRECVELSITDVWMHRSFGVGSVFAAAEYTRNHRDRRRLPADVQPTADFGHKAMRFVLTPRRGAQADLRIRDPRGGALVGVRAAGGRRSPSAGSAGSCSPPRGSARRHPRARLPGPKRRTAPGPRTRRPTPRYQRRAHRPEA